ncbi:MAG: hypothetical protein RR141_04245 [Rikenellaceae bacterium]
MNTIVLTFIITVFAVGFMVFALLITYLRKGHHIESEIGDNPNMKKKGIKCTSRTIMEEEKAIFGDKIDMAKACNGSCGDCVTECSDKKTL